MRELLRVLDMLEQILVRYYLCGSNSLRYKCDARQAYPWKTRKYKPKLEILQVENKFADSIEVICALIFTYTKICLVSNSISDKDKIVSKRLKTLLNMICQETNRCCMLPISYRSLKYLKSSVSLYISLQEHSNKI